MKHQWKKLQYIEQTEQGSMITWHSSKCCKRNWGVKELMTVLLVVSIIFLLQVRRVASMISAF